MGKKLIPKKIIIKNAKSQGDIQEIKRIQHLTSKAMGFPKLRRMGDGSPIPHKTIIDGYEKEIPLLDGYGEPVLDGYGEPVITVEKFEIIRKIYLIDPYMRNYDAIHVDGYGERIATSPPPKGLLKNERDERIRNRHLSEEEQAELEALCVDERDIPEDWNKPDLNNTPGELNEVITPVEHGKKVGKQK